MNLDREENAEMQIAFTEELAWEEDRLEELNRRLSEFDLIGRKIQYQSKFQSGEKNGQVG